MPLPFLIPGLMALGGAIIGGASGWGKNKQQQEALEKQKSDAWKAYGISQAEADALFGIQKGEGLYQAGIAQNRLDQGVGFGVEGFNNSLLAQAYGLQDARIGLASSVGSSLAAEAASGARGSGSGSLMRSYAERGLERDAELQGLGNSLSLRSMLAEAGDSARAISHDVESWSAGGWRQESKAAQDAANQQRAQMGQDAYQWQIDGVANNAWADTLLGGINGAYTGWNLGNSINSLKDASGGQAQSFAGVGYGADGGGLNAGYGSLHNYQFPSLGAKNSVPGLNMDFWR